MIIYPAMDLYNGQVVKLESRKHKGQEKIYGTPGQVTDKWITAGAEWIHIVDLNAALSEGMPNHLALLTILPKAARRGVRIQWGGGVRDSAMLRLLLDAQMGDNEGCIDCVIVGTRAIKDWAWLQSAADTYPDRIIVAIDARGRKIVTDGWQHSAGIDAIDFLANGKDVPISGFLYTNVEVEGKGEGVDWEPVREVIQASPKPVIFSGGITSLEDVARFKDLNAHGIIIGSALYSNTIDFVKAKKLAQ